MIGDQKTITMIHTLGVFYSLNQATNAYQGKVLAFIWDRWATRDPTPICLLQTKAWQWSAGKASEDAQSFKAHYANSAIQGTWWRPMGETTEIKAPYLLALPNALVELLRDQNMPAMLANILTTINEVMVNAGGGLAEELWSTVRDWFICAGQAGQNNKSLLSIEDGSVSIDDDKLDTWVGHKLNQALGPGPTQAQQAVTTPQHPPMTDYLQLSQLLAATVGQGMMHFTQAVAPQAPAGAILLGQTASL
jgi:hypothetical protein